MRLPFAIQNSEGHPIRGEVRAPRRGIDRGTVVFCHGFKGFWAWGGFPRFLDAAAAQGFFAVGFNFSGSGVCVGDVVDEPERFAENTFSRQVADLIDVVGALRSGGLPPHGRVNGPVGLVGHSMGGGTAILAAAELPDISAVVTWGAVSTVERFPPEMVAQWRRQGWTTIVNARTGQELRMSMAYLDDVDANREQLDIVKAASRLTAPLLLVHGEDDETVPLTDARAIHASVPAERAARLVVVPGAGHTFGTVHPFQGATDGFERAVAETTRWLLDHMSF